MVTLSISQVSVLISLWVISLIVASRWSRRSWRLEPHRLVRRISDARKDHDGWYLYIGRPEDPLRRVLDRARSIK